MCLGCSLRIAMCSGDEALEAMVEFVIRMLFRQQQYQLVCPCHPSLHVKVNELAEVHAP